ncbi:UBX domain-containing protein 10 isoform X2 [Ovis canadensis]|uniref:UBX domain-containing protein 10 isoform X2 n=1 Tax=Ovis canadensis TaxID=37174 RepID=UPI003752FD72
MQPCWQHGDRQLPLAARLTQHACHEAQVCQGTHSAKTAQAPGHRGLFRLRPGFSTSSHSLRVAEQPETRSLLPRISRRTLEEGALETVAKKAGSLQLSSAQALSQEEACTTKMGEKDPQAHTCSPERRVLVRTKRQTSSRVGDLKEPSDEEPRLLLAIRSPSGRRFVRHFRPTDDLQTVVAVAEHKNEATYQHCAVETMEVPRRRFSDLSKSLQDCGIPNKSVLGISQEEGEGWS